MSSWLYEQAWWRVTPRLDILWVAGLGAFAIVSVLMPWVLRAWRALGQRDNEVSLRKVHAGEIPRAGGLVVLFGFGVMLLVGLAGTTELSAIHQLFSVTPLSGGLIGALIVGLTGLYDDLVGMRARHKLVMQIAAATIAILYGLYWPGLELYAGWRWHFVTPILTGLFLVATVNAINLMDGLDGLAGGICLIGFGFVVASIAAAPFVGPVNLAVGWIAAAAFGATAGFLIHNRHPAKVFLGDSGSYFLGFLLGVLLLHTRPIRWRVAELQLAIPLMMLALPFFDMGMAVLRRKLRGQPIFASDSDHVHHRLLAAGLSHARAVTVLWASTAMFALMAYFNVIGVGGWWTLLGTIIALVLAAVLLGYHRLLGRLPAFSGTRRVGWRDRRREVMELLAMLKHLDDDGADDRGPDRWRRLSPGVGAVLGRLGVPAFEVHRGRDLIVSQGDSGETWAWLGSPIPDSDGAEVRLALAVRLPDLQQEQLMLLERTVGVLAGHQVVERQSAT
ncbi:MAG: undecaprenyl/decaprenyl-phosphate alpha-N-acetylglucosaminyl 1-phosphate transferase [Nannocystaceae bacterium]|nr:undecaprenyl/decaprenyl-phosphate alpha-N-acetylglucosaminyl 1-phosphate transferase [Nannocystaceae bacterium]